MVPSPCSGGQAALVCVRWAGVREPDLVGGLILLRYRVVTVVPVFQLNICD